MLRRVPHRNGSERQPNLRTADSSVPWADGVAAAAATPSATRAAVTGSAFARNPAAPSGAKAVDGKYVETAALLAGAIIGQYGAWLAWMYAASRFKGFGSLRADFGLFVDLARDWPMLPLGLGLEVVAGIVLLPISHFVSHAPQRVVQDLNAAHGAKLALLSITALVIAPFVEELFFRGLLLRSLQRRVSAPAAVVISALAFGLAHVVFDFGSGVVLPALVALGMLSGIFAVRTGNLSRSILLHMGFNLLAVVAVLTNR